MSKKQLHANSMRTLAHTSATVVQEATDERKTNTKRTVKTC